MEQGTARDTLSQDSQTPPGEEAAAVVGDGDVVAVAAVGDIAMDTMPLDSAERHREQLLAVRLFNGAYAIGRTLEELQLQNFGVKVTALRRAFSYS